MVVDQVVDEGIVVVPGQQVPHEVEGAHDPVDLIPVDRPIHPHGRFGVMSPGGLGRDGDEELIPTHPAFSDALDVGKLGVLVLDVVHHLGPLGVRVVPFPGNGEVQLPVVTSRVLLEFGLGECRFEARRQKEDSEEACRQEPQALLRMHDFLLS